MNSTLFPLDKKHIAQLKAGDEIAYTGIVYTARDQAHKRLEQAIRTGKKLPFELKGQIIYYCGPTKTPPGKVIGACGPTTSSRMDAFTHVLLRAGLFGMIGKGGRCETVRQSIKKYRGIYFLTYAGCGALLAQYITKATVVAYRDLGPEAIYRLEVRDLPLIVGIDSCARDIYRK
jgi:fumarate hydratase subunit beta